MQKYDEQYLNEMSERIALLIKKYEELEEYETCSILLNYKLRILPRIVSAFVSHNYVKEEMTHLLSPSPDQ
jgi:hypothetical protein